MTIWGYARVSTNDQKTENQKLAVLEYANKNGLTVDHWIEAKASARKSAKARKLHELKQLVKGDTLITAELSRLGRSVGQIAMIVDELLHNKVKLICIKENMELTGKRNVQSKVMITMFSLFAEIERDLISERTKEGLQGQGLKESCLAALKAAWENQNWMVSRRRSRATLKRG